MRGVNSVVLIGNLTKDPELRHTPSGTSVTTLRIAVNDRVKRQGEWEDAAYYFDIVVWGKQAEACAEYLAKGRKVGAQGKLTWREWEAQDGSKRQSVEIVADTVQFLSPRENGSGGMSSSDDYGYVPPGDDFGVPGHEPIPDHAPEPAGTTTQADDFAPGHADDDIPF